MNTTPRHGDAGACPGGKECRAKDPYETTWTACSGDKQPGPCPNKADGLAYWKCLDDGEFEGPSPDYKSCTTGWVKEIQDELNELSVGFIIYTLNFETKLKYPMILEQSWNDGASTFDQN